MNRILTKVLEQRKGHYCHALEVGSVDELTNIVDQVIEDFYNTPDNFTLDEIKEFINTMEIYYSDIDKGDDDKEEQFYAFNLSDYLNNFNN